MAKNPAAERIALNVSQAIVIAGKSKNWLAEDSGIPYSTLGRKLKGDTEFTITEILAVAESLGIHPSRLLTPEFGVRAAAA